MLNSFGVIPSNDLISNHCFTFQLLVNLCQGLLQVGPDDEQVFGGNTALDHTRPYASTADTGSSEAMNPYLTELKGFCEIIAFRALAPCKRYPTVAQ